MTTLLPPSTDVSHMPHADLPAIWDAFRAQAEAIKATAETLIVTSADQKDLMALARTTRLTLKKLRVDIDKKRKELKEEALKTSQTIDAAGRWLRELIEPLEERLLYQEQFAERQEELRRVQLHHAREGDLAPYHVDISLLADLGSMTEEAFEAVLANAKVVKLARETEEVRRAQELEEQKQAAAEVVRLKKEREELERAGEVERAKLAFERQQMEAARRQEQQKREAAEKELADKRAMEKAAVLEWEAAARKLAAAPDREKLMVLAGTVRGIAMPVATSELGTIAFGNVTVALGQFAAWIEGEGEKL